MKTAFLLTIAASLAGSAWALMDPAHSCGRHAPFTTMRYTRGFCRSSPFSARECLRMITSAQQDFRKTVRHADENPKSLDPDRFAVCAFPDSPSAGKYLYMREQNNRIFRSSADGRRGIEVFPNDGELKLKWTKLD